MHDGAVTFGQMEANGIRVDVPYLRQTMEDQANRITHLTNRLKETEIWDKWVVRYGAEKANITSGDQLGDVLFNVVGYPHCGHTSTGQLRTDADTLATVDHPFVKNYLKLKKLHKLDGTYLRGIYHEVDLATGLLHPFFNLHTVVTYRSSSDNPNFQNIPIRDPDIGRLIRQAFIARLGCRLVESDISGAEVRVATCYHRDPTMLKYLIEGHDMHRDMAAQLFFLPLDKVPKMCRQAAKGIFVFAAFYGDYYVAIAAGLWEEALKLVTADGIPMREHLAKNGITELGDQKRNGKPNELRAGTYEKHVQQVEDDFWGVRFPVYDRWRNDWYAAYKKTGSFDTLTGFHVEGIYKRNEVINNPVQGSAFHCLLWATIEIQRELRSRKMGALLVGQIHDSLLADVPDEEMGEYAGLVQDVMTNRLPKAWKWIITPMEIEIDASPVNGNWYEKAPYTAA